MAGACRSFCSALAVACRRPASEARALFRSPAMVRPGNAG